MVEAPAGVGRVIGRSLLITLILFAVACPQARAQVVAKPKQQFVKRPSLIVLGGYGVPLSHESLTEFWNGSASGSLQFLVPVQRSLSFGVGLDGTYLPFDEASFAARYGSEVDSIPSSNMGLFSLSLISRFIFAPGYRLTPYLTAGLGASHVTGAVYKEKVSGVTRRYFDIPRKTRLSAQLAAGMALALSPSVAIDAEGRATYIVNDDDLGLLVCLLVGVRFRL